MKAFHSTWTRPFMARSPNTAYHIEPFELLTTMLSALSWRANGGEILMVTDACGAAYYNDLGLSNLWNGGIHPLLEDAVPASVSPSIFWAAGKLYALRQISAPCVMLDTDFIAWKNMQPLFQNCSAAAIHQEELMPDIYPDATYFRTPPAIDLTTLDWTVRPYNTALAYFQDDAFRQYYTTHAIAFMEHACNADNPLTYMVFAEQRLLAMCAAAYGISIRSLSNLPVLFSPEQTYFTHVWGFKQHMRDEPTLCHAFCRQCATRITRDYPNYAAIAARIASLHRYFS